MVLWELSKSQRGRVTDVDNELPERYQLRLKELGFRAGEVIECVRVTPFGGPKIYRVGDSVFSVARDIAQSVRIVVVGAEGI